MTHTDGFSNVEVLINRFGGMRPMARKMDVAVSTIQGWKKRDHIPAERVEEIIKAAKANHISLDGFYNSANSQSVDNATANENNKKINEAPIVSKPTFDTNSTTTQTHTPQMNYQHQTHTNFFKKSAITTVSILAVLGGLGYVLFGQDVKKIASIAQEDTNASAQINIIKDKYNSFESTVTEGLNTLNTQVTDIAAAVGVQRNSEGEIVLNNNLSLSERVTGLESRLRSAGEEIDLGQIVNQFQSLNKTIDQKGTLNDTALTDLRGIVNSMQARIGILDAQLAEAKANNADLAKSLENVSGRDLSAAAMLMAMMQMRNSLNREQPFAEDLAIMQNIVGDDDPELTAALNRLAPYAEQGVLSPEGLSVELRSLTGEIISAALKGEDVSIKEKIMARIGQILSIEKDGKPVIGIKEQTIIAKAQNALDKGDVETAMAELNKLDGHAANAAEPITNQIMDAIQADNAVDSMMQKLLEKLKNPTDIQSLVNELPADITGQNNRKIQGSVESGLIILE